MDQFFVNIAYPPSIVIVAGAEPTRLSGTIEIAASGPHGLDLDATGRLYCACDAGQLFVLSAGDHRVVADLALSGSPDVIFLDPAQGHLYVAIGEPGLIEVFDVDRLVRIGAVETERGAHTIGLDVDTHRVCAFLPHSHRASVYSENRSSRQGSASLL